ncbi:MAG TPA: NUDIX domain-containing protein [Marmoricola sp.]|jgi:8-oxo-dGTP diphosphatase
MSDALPRRVRLGAYAVIIRSDHILLSRLAPHLTSEERWTLPGGGVEFGEHPRDSVVREVHEETGLAVEVGDTARVYDVSGVGERGGELVQYHSIRLVYEGWVPTDAPEPRVVEVDGSTVDARWHPVADVLTGAVPTVRLVAEALADHETFRLQRPAAYALVRRDAEVLLTRISAVGHHSGSWTLPGGGIDHGESPRQAVVREAREETGLSVRVGALLGVDDVHFSGTAPNGRLEDFHGIHLVFAATVPDDAEPRVVESGGTTDAVAWVKVADVREGRLDALDIVHFALDAEGRS